MRRTAPTQQPPSLRPQVPPPQTNRCGFLRRSRWSTVLALTVIGLTLGCRTVQTPDFDTLYTRAAQVRDDQRNPVIVIPGILGSRLESADGTVVWGAFDKTTAKPNQPDGSRLVGLPIDTNQALASLADDVRATAVLDRVLVRLLGIPVTLRAYANLLATLGVHGGYRDSVVSLSDVDYGTEHFTCFQFPYDWRQDISQSAAALDQFIRDKKAFVEAEMERRYGIKKDVKFDLVAHSMGGLVARYYLRYGSQQLQEAGPLPDLTWAGANFVDKAILVGPPSHGSVETLNRLVDGFKPGPFIPKYSPILIGTMPSAYQLLPRPRHLSIVDQHAPDTAFEDLYDPEVWEQLGWGLLDPAEDRTLSWLLPGIPTASERRDVARSFLSRSLSLAQRFARAMDTPATPPEGLALYLVAGDSTPTVDRVGVDLRTGKRAVLDMAPGDGTVLRTSALGDERKGGEWVRRMQSPIDWRQVMFVFNDHIGLTKDPMFIDNLLYLLLEQ